MDTRRLVVGSIVGGIALYLVGYLIWTVTFADFFAANTGSATGLVRDARVLWAVLLGNLAMGVLMTLAIGSRPGSVSTMEGAKIGAIIGFLAWLSVDLIHYGVLNRSNLVATLVDPLLELVHGGIAGAVIAATLARLTSSRRVATQPA